MAEAMFPYFSTVKLFLCLPPCPFHNVFFGRKSLCEGHTSQVGSYTPLPRRWSIYANYSGFLCTEDLSLALHVFIQAFIHISVWINTHEYFILWISQHFILLLKLSQLWPLGGLSVGSCAPLKHSITVYLFVWTPPYFSGTIRCSRLILYISWNHPRFQLFLQGFLIYFTGE